MSELVPAELMSIGIEAARKGGEILQDWASRFSVQEKSCAADVVTEADLESQQAIYTLIHSAFPAHAFLGEEGLNKSSDDSPYRWIIDPLDGTSNYVHGFPYYAVSIGLEHSGRLVGGIIYDPTRDDLYHASLGRGAWCNDRRLCVSSVSSMKQALLVASFPPGAGPQTPAIQQFLKILPQAQTVQRTGSAAMNLAHLAAGRLDGFWSYSLKPWDVAAGAVILQEAGGRVSATSGSPLRIEVSDLLATNGSDLHASLQQALTG